MNQERISLSDSWDVALAKITDENAAAKDCVDQVMQHAESIDPQHILGPLGVIFILDELGIFGSRLERLYHQQCGGDVRKLILLIRADQLNFISTDRLLALADESSGEPLLDETEFTEIDRKVCERLVHFQRPQ